MSDKGPFCGINKPANPANLTELEKKHIPVIDCPDTVKAGKPFQVKIKVGEVPHVSEEAHHIQWIEVKTGENLYARVDLTPVLSLPEVTITLKKAGKHRKTTIRAVERCNMHGLWEAEKEITVEE